VVPTYLQEVCFECSLNFFCIFLCGNMQSFIKFTQKCKYLYISYCRRRVVSFSPHLVHPLMSTFLHFQISTFFWPRHVCFFEQSLSSSLETLNHCLHQQQNVSSFLQTTHLRNATFFQNYLHLIWKKGCFQNHSH